MSKKVTNKIPLPVLKNARRKLDELMDMLAPYLVTLSPTERQPLVKMRADYLKFIDVSYGLALENPELFSGFFETVTFGEDFSAAHELLSFAAALNQLRDNMSDTEMAAGNCGLQAALAFYNTVKIAARHNIPGVRMIYEKLKSRRPLGRRKQR